MKGKLYILKCTEWWSLSKTTIPSLAESSEWYLSGADFTPLKEKQYISAVIALHRCMLIVFSPSVHTSQQVVLSCSPGARHTFYLKRQQIELPAASCAALPVFLSLLLLHLGFLKSAGREPGAHHFNAVQNGICIIICKPYVRETAQLWISGGQERESS